MGQPSLLRKDVGSAAATAADDGAETEPRTTAPVFSANCEGSAELLGGETKAASAHETNSGHGVSPLGTDSSADEGADDKQSDRAVDTVFADLVCHGDRARLPFWFGPPHPRRWMDESA